MTARDGITSPAGRRLAATLPPFVVDDSQVFAGLLQAEGLELDSLRTSLADALANLFVNTAVWGLDRMEEELGLAPKALTSTERRDRVRGKLRGSGTATLYAVKQAALAYALGAVEVVPDWTNWRVIVRFLDTRGIPSNLTDLQAGLREMVPLALEVAYEYRYTTYNEMTASAKTYDQVTASGKTYDQLLVTDPTTL